MTSQERLVWQKEYRLRTRNSCTRKYEKTKSGFLVRLYRNMKSRIEGIQYLKAHLYQNKELLDKESFYSWANSQEAFHNLFDVWEHSRYDRKLTPSVDRKESSRGYTIDNMEWVTHSENSRRGSRNRHGKTRSNS